MDATQRLLLSNQAWAQEKVSLKPNYFKDLAKDQRPEFLWIGCSDSRVPAEEVTGTQPGDLFVHRTIANLVIHTDLNLLSVLYYAVDVLKVKHIIVCGHYGCGGVRAALGHQQLGILNKWLCNLKDTYEDNEAELKEQPSELATWNRFVELNVKQQIKNLSKTSVIQKAWATEQRPVLHGWVFQIDSGLLKTICTMEPGSPIPEIFRFDLTQ